MMRGRRGRPDFRGGHPGHHRGRRGLSHHIRGSPHGGRGFGGELPHQKYRSPYSNGPEGLVPEVEHVAHMVGGDGLMPDGRHVETHGGHMERESLMVTINQGEDEVLTEEDGEIREDPPADALLPTPGSRPPLLASPPALLGTPKRPPGPPPGPPPEGAKPFAPIGLTHQGKMMFKRSAVFSHPPPSEEDRQMEPQQEAYEEDMANSEPTLEAESLMDPPRQVELHSEHEISEIHSHRPDIMQIPQDTTQLPPDMTRPPPDMPHRPNDMPHRPHDMSHRPPDMPHRPPHDMPHRPPDMLHRPHDMPYRPTDMPQRPPDMSHRPPDMSHRPPDISHRPQDMPHRPPDMPHRPDMPSRIVRKPEPDTGVKAKDENGIPMFLLCPLCKDLLLKPLVLPCFHAICGERCVPKLDDDGFNIWCPTCKQLKHTKAGINYLKPAETFGKMSQKIRDERRQQGIEKGEIPEHCTIEEYEAEEAQKGTRADDLVCPECNKLFSLPLKLPCSHSICKFPCAYKMLKHNVKIVCSICEKPNYCNNGVKDLPVDETIVECLKDIKGDFFEEQFEQKLRDIAEGKDLQRKRDDGGPVNEDDLNKYRFQKVNSAEQLSKAVPSLLSLDVNLKPDAMRQKLHKPPNHEMGPGGQGFPRPNHIPHQSHGEYLENQVSEELRKIRNDQDNDPNFQPSDDTFSSTRPCGEDMPESEQANAEEEEYVAEELPPELAEMANAWAGPKRARPPTNRTNEKPHRQHPNQQQFQQDHGNRGERFRKYERSRDRNKAIDDSAPPGIEVFEYNNRSKPQNPPVSAPSLLDLDIKPPPALRKGRRGYGGLPPLEELYPELEDEMRFRRAFPHRMPPLRDLMDEMEGDPFLDALPPLGRPPPLGLPPMGIPPLGPDGLPLEGLPPMGPKGPLGPPPMEGMQPPPNTSEVGLRPSVPGLNVMLTPVTTSIPSMLYSSGSGPPPIVNYGTPSSTETVTTPAAAPIMQPGPALPEPGQLQAAPATLPVMDPSTIPTMSSAFEYQAHWTKFVQQTQAYYNNLYAAQGGTPAEAQQTINDYLAKCWAWYSAYTNLCLVNPDYKEMGKEGKKEKQLPQQPAAEASGEVTAEEKKKEAKKQKKKKNKTNKTNKPTAAEEAATSKAAESAEEKELEELKIMLLKKQLELKVKHARNKSELRGLMNMKKLIMEEEGEEKVEEIDEEEREKVKEAAKQKQLERAQEIERQERERAKDREKEIQRLEQERIRERERERQREREMRKKEAEDKARREKQREKQKQRGGHRGDDNYRKKKRKQYSRSRSRSYSRSRSRSNSRSRSPVQEFRRKPVKEMPKPDELKDEEPKFIKIANLPDELKAVDLKSFVEAFGRVLNCKIGKMQGEMMAVVQMASLADAMSCVRDMQGSQFKTKILEVKYMGNKPNLKSVEVSIPDVYSGPSSSANKPKGMPPYKSMAGPGPGYGYGQDYYNKPSEIRHIWIGNLPWGTTEDEVMRFVYYHGTPLHCKLGTSSDPSQKGPYAIVTMESYIDVLKCINSLHGIRYEGKTLDVKKMKY